MMKRPEEADRLERRKEQFIGKPLSRLLREIGPEIKLVLADGDRPHGAPSYFVFLFADWEGWAALRRAGKNPTRVRVMIREKFSWQRDSLPAPKRNQWTKKEEHLYGNLTVVDLRVSIN